MNIYYHFFDRELRESVNAKLNDGDILKVILVSLLMTDNFFYLPISNLYESYFQFPESVKLINILNHMGILKLASSHDKVENFILSRQYLYSHDKERYPMYFNDDINIWSNDLIVLTDSTTKVLTDKIIIEGVRIKELKDSEDIINDRLKEILLNNKSKALTFSLFKNEDFGKKYNANEIKTLRWEIRKSISINYTKRYLEVLNGRIITGIKDIGYYDCIINDRFSTNYQIMCRILKNINFDISSERFMTIILNLRKKERLFYCIYKKIHDFIKVLAGVYKDKLIYNNAILCVNKPFKKVTSEYGFVENLYEYIDYFYLNRKEIQEKVKEMNGQHRIIVIVAVTSIEMRSIIETLRNTLSEALIKELIIGDLVCREVIGYDDKIIIVQSGMGSSGANSVINVLHKVFNWFKPQLVLMVGIAFGVDCEKQNIGDILVSQQVWNYEPMKIKEDVKIPRGDKISASSFLLQLYHSTELDYTGVIHFGLFASGEKLINSKEIIKELKELEPEIIGGDMESAGLVSVCNNEKVDWIVIKAICDWGMHKTDDWQKKAADNASDFLIKGLLKIIN